MFLKKAIYLSLIFSVVCAHADFVTPIEVGRQKMASRQIGGQTAYVTEVQYKVPRSLEREAVMADFRRLEISFIVRSRSEFHALKSHFTFPGSGQSLTKPPASYPHTFMLEDFLPPAMRALSGKQWRGLNLSKMDQQPTGANCWSTAYEVTRLGLSGDLDLIISQDLMGGTFKVFEDADLFTPLLRQKMAVAEDLSFVSRLGPVLQKGDLLLIKGFEEIFPGSGRGEFGISHAAVYLGDGLYFEKFSADDSGAYRVVGFQTIIDGRIKLNRQSPTEMHWLRPTGRPLPKLSAVIPRPFDVTTVPSFREVPLMGGIFPTTYKVAPIQITAKDGGAFLPTQPLSFDLTALVDTVLTDDEGQTCRIKAGTRLRVDEVIGFWRPDEQTRLVFAPHEALRRCSCDRSENHVCNIKTAEWIKSSCADQLTERGR